MTNEKQEFSVTVIGGMPGGRISFQIKSGPGGVGVSSSKSDVVVPEGGSFNLVVQITKGAPEGSTKIDVQTVAEDATNSCKFDVNVRDAPDTSTAPVLDSAPSGPNRELLGSLFAVALAGGFLAFRRRRVAQLG